MILTEKEFNVENQTEACINWIKDWFENDSGGAKGIILGISGGKDSTVAAELCAMAIGAENVLGVLMPDGEQLDILDSYAACESSHIHSMVVNIGDITKSFVNAIEFSNSQLNFQSRTNIAPRIRMSVLYAIGQNMNYRVCGTGNQSENVVGYFTKWGDGACDFNPLANFTTDEVVAIGDYLDIPWGLTHKVPADGLCGQTDEDNLGVTYAEINNFIKNIVRPFAPYDVTDSCDKYPEVLKKYRAASHKNNPIPEFKW